MLTFVFRRETFEALDNWIANAKANCTEDAIFVLMGNQADLGDM